MEVISYSSRPPTVTVGQVIITGLLVPQTTVPGHVQGTAISGVVDTTGTLSIKSMVSTLHTLFSMSTMAIIILLLMPYKLWRFMLLCDYTFQKLILRVYYSFSSIVA